MQKLTAAVAALAIVMFSAIFALAQTPPPAPNAGPPITPEPPLSAADQELGKGKVIGLDYFFNHQVRNGQQFHYIWEESDINGYSRFGDVWKEYGATLDSLKKAPTLADLQKFSVYIIVNPNTAAKSAPNPPNFIMPADVDAIVAWVQSGGVLALFANDKNNSEFEHLNTLSTRFGITFNEDLRNTAPSTRDQPHGTFHAAQFQPHPVLDGVPAIYMKEICTLQVKDPATAILTVDKEPEQGTGKDIIMASSKFGKGLVFAVGDPWVYNEYIDVHPTGMNVDNRLATIKLCRWLLQSASAPQAK